ncbi:hypothetical protein LIER_15707 [Lithospermum erythrorhizon]|uniref:Uncharacterized protein n=1 Tax=Lithospermum erythrorhizon TaxID=34254 RepID=A0AAV3Q6I3_LITER
MDSIHYRTSNVNDIYKHIAELGLVLFFARLRRIVVLMAPPDRLHGGLCLPSGALDRRVIDGTTGALINDASKFTFHAFGDMVALFDTIAP